MTRNIENLVFKGGGVLGIAYAGAIEILENEGILTQVQRTAGTSAGAVAAALISLGYSSKEIIAVLGDTNLKQFQELVLLLQQQKKLLHLFIQMVQI